MNISFIGYGKMAKSLANGWRQSKHYHLRAAAPSLTKAISAEGIETTPSNSDVIRDADVIILAVKPVHMTEVMLEIGAAIPPGCMLISIATGLTLAWFSKYIPETTPVVRVMPNIAAAIQLSATPLIKNQFVNAHQSQIAEQLFNAVGITSWIQDEAQMDVFTALSGSGPAYVFQFIQSMVTAAMNMGLDERTATTFTLQTINGATALAHDHTQTLQQLTDQVTSKGGTTAAALNILHHRQFSLIVEEAMKAAQNRARELYYT